MTSFKLCQVRQKQDYHTVKGRPQFFHIFSPKRVLSCTKALAHFCRQCSTSHLCASFSAVRRRAVEHPQPEWAGALEPNSAQIGPKLRPGELFYCQNSIKMRIYEDICVSPSNVHQITWSQKRLIARDHSYLSALRLQQHVSWLCHNSPFIPVTLLWLLSLRVTCSDKTWHTPSLPNSAQNSMNGGSIESNCIGLFSCNTRLLIRLAISAL